MNFDKNTLEQKVNEIASEFGKIVINDMLAGGVVSDIYSATLTDETGNSRNIVVKYTKPEIPVSKIFSKTDIENSFSKAPATHNLDVQLQEEIALATPEIIKHFPEEKITLMEDFRDDGFELLQNLILDDNLPQGSARNMGRMLAEIRYKFMNLPEGFDEVEASRTQFDERFYELKTLLYNSRMDIFNEIENQFLDSETKQLTWTDGDQKNFAVTANGDVIAFDMGRSVVCDPEFMLPNLLGHLGLFFLGGYIDNALDFFHDVIEGFLEEYRKYDKGYEIDEKRFCNYFVAGTLHRGMAMRWIDPRIGQKYGEDSMKNACMHFGDLVFDKENRCESIDQILQLLNAVRKLASEGKYRRPTLSL